MTMSLIGVASVSDDTQPAPITNAACEDHWIAQLMYVCTVCNVDDNVWLTQPEGIDGPCGCVQLTMRYCVFSLIMCFQTLHVYTSFVLWSHKCTSKAQLHAWLLCSDLNFSDLNFSDHEMHFNGNARTYHNHVIPSHSGIFKIL